MYSFSRMVLPALFLLFLISLFLTPRRRSNVSSLLMPFHEEKRLVVASEKNDDITWIHRRLPGLPVSRYVVDDSAANLTVPIKKGREAMVYLTSVLRACCYFYFLSSHTSDTKF